MNQDNHCDGCEAVDQLRRELEEKHRQNRTDIHQLRNGAQAVLLELAELKGQLLPIVGDKQPGLLAQISTKLDELSRQVVSLQIAQGADTGRRSEHEWLRAVIASAIVGGLLIIAQHAWK